MTKLDRLFGKLKNSGFEVEKIHLKNVDSHFGNVPALRIDTDYDGMYPSQETWDKIQAIRKVCAGKFHTETRGFYTAVFIYEM